MSADSAQPRKCSLVAKPLYCARAMSEYETVREGRSSHMSHRWTERGHRKWCLNDKCLCFLSSVWTITIMNAPLHLQAWILKEPSSVYTLSMHHSLSVLILSVHLMYHTQQHHSTGSSQPYKQSKKGACEGLEPCKAIISYSPPIPPIQPPPVHLLKHGHTPYL